jgi:hypothetical protein
LFSSTIFWYAPQIQDFESRYAGYLLCRLVGHYQNDFDTVP